jgi:two-component system sensor kinase FixL
MIGRILKAGKPKILAIALALLLLTAFLDWLVGKNVSLATLYILPVMAAAIVVRPLEIVIFAFVCSYLRQRFEVGASPMELTLRFIFAVLAYVLSGLFVTVLVRNHELAVQHLARLQAEQSRRREAEEQLRLLAASSPAAIVTADKQGVVLAANGAAESLFSIPEGQTLCGRDIGSYLPVLTEALGVDVGPEGLRTAVQCQGTRENGDIFQAHIWFSSYATHEGPRLAAIVVDSSEEMRDRAEQGLHELMRGNRIAAAATAHEVRNFCVAMALLCGNLRQRPEMAHDADIVGLSSLLGGLETIASRELASQSGDSVQPVSLKEVLDVLRIVIEPAWRDIDGHIVWPLPSQLPLVIAESRALLQTFLNLAQNSHRAVQGNEERELRISTELQSKTLTVRFHDSGPGVKSPEHLFRPFQSGASGSGMGLYVSRFIVRSYGGELRYEPTAAGACFAVELETA